MNASNHGHRVLENEWIELADGTRLAARIWLPDETFSASAPAILEYLPYKKRGGTDQRDDATYPHFARHGYAGIRVDIRGNGESDGFMEDEYTARELSDGAEVIAWIAAQDWCDGNVGMIGISWGGFNGLQIAALNPPALKTIITVCSTDDRYADDVHFMGGCLLNDNLAWSAQMLCLSSRPPDPQLVGDNWRTLWLERLQAMSLLAANWLRHQRRDEFWKHGSVCEDFGAIKVPVLAVGGWHDPYCNAIPRMLCGLGSPVKGLIGPWEHKYPHIATVGPAIDFLGECVRWWDRWLKGEINGVEDEPALRAYLMRSAPPSAGSGHRDGVWVAEDIWPSPNIELRTLHLTNGGLADSPAHHEPIVVSTAQDVGLMGGNFIPGMRVDDELAGDQRADDEKSVLFETDPLDEDLGILGAAELEFDFTCTTPDGFIVARLCDVAPDGASVRVSFNPRNLTRLVSHETPEPLEPGRRYRLRLRLRDTGYVFAKGHRIRLALSTSYWPMIWPSASTPAITLLPGTGRLVLPVHPVAGSGPVELPPAPPQPESAFEVLRERGNSREVSYGDDGVVTVEWADDMGHIRDSVNGLETASTVRQRYMIDPDDPLSARTEVAWTFETRRGDWHVSTSTSSAMTADAENFHLSARLEVFENGEPVAERVWNETIGRDHV